MSCGWSTPTRKTPRDPGEFPATPAPGARGGEGLHHPDQQAEPADEGSRGTPGSSGPAPGRRKRPQLALPYQDASWWVLVKLDSALVSSPRTDQRRLVPAGPELFRSLAWRSPLLHCPAAPAGGRGWSRNTGPRRPSSPRPRRGGDLRGVVRQPTGWPVSPVPTGSRPVPRAGRAGQPSRAGRPAGHTRGPAGRPRPGVPSRSSLRRRGHGRARTVGAGTRLAMGNARWPPGGPPC